MKVLTTELRRLLYQCGIAAGLTTALLVNPAYADVAQSPLLLGSGNVPGNLVLTPSVEFPTVISVANLGEYDLNASYAGYFDSGKCYTYVPEDVIGHPIFKTIKKEDGGGYFTPENFGFRDSKDCAGLWSGHYLNWAATQTIDTFRKALTGGYRVVDTPSKTILEKATREGKSDNQYYPISREIPNETVSLVTPYTSSVSGLQTSVSSGNTDYKKNKTLEVKHTEKCTGRSCKNISTTKYYSVRVEVCKSARLREANCVAYGSNFKPEGLLQKYSDSIRYSVFSYLNINGNSVDGGVLRSPQDYIGPQRRDPNTPGVQENLTAEWDAETGVLEKNPRGDAIKNSGVINYINKFGEISGNLKQNDPVSELYYAALRYLRGVGNYSKYTDPAQNSTQKDHFPVYTTWVDPIQYACQRNAILGIGDINTHQDGGLLPSDDDTFMAPHGLIGYTGKVFALAGVNKTVNAHFSGSSTHNNRAYIAGLAYFANTEDIRPGDKFPGKQTASTYWVDVREKQELEDRKNNQYWLATKFGGFVVPEDYKFGDPLERSWWNQSGDTLVDKNGKTDYRPDNFFVASDAEAMVQSLSQAFAQIVAEVQSTTTALAANTSRLETGTAVFQSRLNSRQWSGDLLALPIDEDGVVSDTPAWSAAAKLDALADTAAVTNRNILSVKAGASPGTTIRTGINFAWSQLDSDQQAHIGSEAVLKYLRGDRSLERTTYRERGSRLGDIVNSDPEFVHQENYGYTRLRSWSDNVATKYSEFRDTEAYKNRIPMVLVGSNDGMLHAFDARLEGGGEELFAYVPNAVYPNLADLADFNYTHRYYVDGTVRVADAWLGSKWATVAVGTTGAGGKSVFALDITDVSGKGSVTSNNVLWEFTHENMGYSMGQPAIVALPNGKFGVIVSSGYHDDAPEKGYVWILDVADGSVIRTFELDTQGNLGGVLAADLTGTAEASRLYVADTVGNVWRIDLDGTTSGSWGIPTDLSSGPLFKVVDSAGSPQAITAPLASAFNERGQHMILFGTGSFYRVGDNEIPDEPVADTLYGLIDEGVLVDGRSDLLEQQIIKEAVQDGLRLRAISDNKMSAESGWYLDLAWYEAEGGSGPKGERVLARAALRSGRVHFTTMTPDEDPCAAGGSSMVMVMDLTSGKRLNYAYFDTNRDGEINDDDYMEKPTEDGDGIPWSGISDEGDGVIKGVNIMYQWICYAGSTGVVKCLPVAGSIAEGRQTWREVRADDE